MISRIKLLAKDKKGLTLVETLVALTILTLVIFCVTPLFLVNFDTIKVSGNKAADIQYNAGIMQKVLGNFKTGDDTANAGYDIDVASADITLSGNGTSYMVKAQGDLLVSNPNDISEGFATVMADSPKSAFQVFPKSLTDDFKEAYLTVAAIGFSFVDEPGSNIYELYCNKDGDPDNCTSSEKLVYGEDYTMRRVKSNDPTAEKRVMQIILYGGTDVNFSNSPLTFKYKTHQEKIQIDAPSAIMVGEKSADGNYYYYVTRGETEKDADGNDRLIVLQKKMGDGVPLTSAMNDVAWVSAEDADQYAVGADGEKYGYYVMCGDNGQIRRFWQDPTTGNYCWGGDYTYYTDINHNRVEGNSYVNAEKVKSTSVSYKFMARRASVGQEGTDGYKLVQGTDSATSKTARKDDAMAVTQNMWTATALDGGAASQYAYFYASDGKMLYYYMNEGQRNGSFDNMLLAKNIGDGTFETVKNSVGKASSYGDWKIRGQGYYDEWDYEALSWLRADGNSYYQIHSVDPSSVNTASYPITLTSVGAIVLQGSDTVGDLQPYAGSTSYANYDVADGGTVIDPDVANYPTETYTLYCGYIPSAYDVWSRKAHDGASLDIARDKTKANLLVAKETLDHYYETANHNNNNSGYDLTVDSYLDRRSNDILEGATEKNMLWRGTFGMTPYISSGKAATIRPNATRVYEGRASSGGRHWMDSMWYWPYTNLGYAVTGKFFDANVDADELAEFQGTLTKKIQLDKNFNENTIYNTRGLPGEIKRQQYLTGGKVIDITCSYFSQPFALHIAANPSIDQNAYMLDNETGEKHFSYYYANRRETVTILKVANAKIPTAGEKDINVSLAVGYAQGGSITFRQSGGTLGIGSTYPAFVNNVMPIGIVYLRAGTAWLTRQQAFGNVTNEYQAVDRTGYRLADESNYFHQFYYLDSKLPKNTTNPNGPGSNSTQDEYNFLGMGLVAHIGNMYGAKYWQNNRHIIFRSSDGGAPDQNDHSTTPNGNYNYVRCHPMIDTKVTCAVWGTTWDNYPEAMWGTDNGTVLSWWARLNAEDLNTEGKEYKYDDNAVEAEFQSYQWIDNVEGKAFQTKSYSWKSTVGVHTAESDSNPNPVSFNYSLTGKTFAIQFRTFFDKSTQENKYYEQGYGFISTLSSINDIEYANDYWVAVGNQATGKTNLRGSVICPALYCGNSSLPNQGSRYYGGSSDVKAYTGNGQGGSWVNVRYWYDAKGTGRQAEDNATYLWKAVKISNNPNYNIVQISCLNGVWFATGYEDANQDGEWNEGEKAVVCWARDPLAPCDGMNNLGSAAPGRWSENTQFYRTTGKGQYTAMPASDVGGINSVACRDDA